MSGIKPLKQVLPIHKQMKRQSANKRLVSVNKFFAADQHVTNDKIRG